MFSFESIRAGLDMSYKADSERRHTINPEINTSTDYDSRPEGSTIEESDIDSSRIRMKRAAKRKKNIHSSKKKQTIPEMPEDVRLFSREKRIGDSSTLHSKIAQTLTYVILFAPSILGIVVADYKIEDFNNVEISKVITDILSIGIVSWFIKFIIDWPWNWRNQLHSMKKKIIADIETATGKETVRLNNNKICDDPETLRLFLALKRILRYESYCFFICLSCMMASTLIVLVSRKSINNGQEKIILVFSNLNISLYLFLGFFRILLVLNDVVQVKTDKLLSFESSDNIVMLTELSIAEIEQLVPSASTSRDVLIDRIMLFVKGAFKLMKEISFRNGEENFNKFHLLHKDFINQEKAVQKISTIQINEFTNIKNSMLRIETKMGDLANNMDAISRNKFSFMRPYSYQTNRKPHIVENTRPMIMGMGQKNSTMYTIFEDKEQEVEDILSGECQLENNYSNFKQIKRSDSITEDKPCQDKVSPSFTQPSSKTGSIFDYPLVTSDENYSPGESSLSSGCNLEKIPLSLGMHYSLHGLPEDSSISGIRTISSIYNTENMSYPNYKDLKNDDSLSTYFWDISNENHMEKESTFGLVVLVLRGLIKRFSITDLFSNPKIIKQTIYLELYPLLLQEILHKMSKIQNRLEYHKHIAYILFQTHMNQSTYTWNTLTNKYWRPIWKMEQFIILVWFKFPLNFSRLITSVLFFIPKTLLKIFKRYLMESHKHDSSDPLIRKSSHGSVIFDYTNYANKDFRFRNIEW